VVASTGKEGDAQEDLKLTEARAMVIRDYLVGSFGFDDAGLKTLGEGKQPDPNSGEDWGSIKIVIFPQGTEVPPDQPLPGGNANTSESGKQFEKAAKPAQQN
jgi:hypothetical protein